MLLKWFWIDSGTLKKCKCSTKIWHIFDHRHHQFLVPKKTFFWPNMGRSPLLPVGVLKFNGGTKSQKSIKNGESKIWILIKISCEAWANFSKNRSPPFRYYINLSFYTRFGIRNVDLMVTALENVSTIGRKLTFFWKFQNRSRTILEAFRNNFESIRRSFDQFLGKKNKFFETQQKIKTSTKNIKNNKTIAKNKKKTLNAKQNKSKPTQHLKQQQKTLRRRGLRPPISGAKPERSM